MTRKLSHLGLVLSSGFIAPEQARLVVSCPEAASMAAPGQFAEVSCHPVPPDAGPAGEPSPGGPFLRRPISFCDVDPHAGTFTLVFRVQGEGTRALSRFRPGDVVSFLGPLGTGFPVPQNGRCIAVGGGIGVYPLLHLLRVCAGRGLATQAVCGYRSPREAFLLEEFRAVADGTLFASDAGGLDFTGNAADALRSLWTTAPPRGPVSVFTCGPAPMMRAVADLCAGHGVPCHVSLEQRMGCGTGICLVCACKVRSHEPGGYEYKRCCIDGPVFPAEEVLWE